MSHSSVIRVSRVLGFMCLVIGGTITVPTASAQLASPPAASAQAPAAQAQSTGQAGARPVVALLTDFGLINEAVGLCHGAILAVDSNIQIVDLSHSVEAYDVLLGALMFRGTTVFPRGTVFVGVVDPGVGTKRRPIAVETRRGLFYVAPDNGLLTYVIREQGIARAVALNAKRINPAWEPGTFDGRDLFSPAGAMLASSRGDLGRIGDAIDPADLVTLETPKAFFDPRTGELSAAYLRTDEPYGNIWTTATHDDLTSAGFRLGDTLRVQIADDLSTSASRASHSVSVPFVVSFGHVPEGAPLAYVASSGNLALAVNMGNFRTKYDIKPGTRLKFSRAAGPGSEGRK